MALVQDIRSIESGIARRIVAVYHSMQEARSRRRVYSQTVRELNSLTSRELDDLGIHRSEIRRIAQEAAFGN